jgi:hypothetical protein
MLAYQAQRQSIADVAAFVKAHELDLSDLHRRPDVCS